MIIADDLTGAIDTGVQLAEQGVSTLVIPELSQDKHLFDFEAIVTNTETRHGSPTEALDAVARAVAFGHGLGVKHFYKKTDSTLRGNLGSEFEALMKATREKQLFFVPAFPRLQRTTCQGQQYVNGVELQKSDFATDPLNPIVTSDVATLVRQQAQVDTHHVSAAELGCLFETRKDGVYIFDCTTDADMQSIAVALQHVRGLTNLAGSGGFAPHLKSVLNLKASDVEAVPKVPGAMLVVNGSLNPGAQRQLSFAARSGFVVIRVDPHDLENQSGAKQTTTGIAEEIVNRLRTENSVVLATTSNRHSMHASSTMLSISERLGELVSEIVHSANLSLLTVFGGDTLSAVARNLKCQRILPLAEVLPGIPLSKFYMCGSELLVVSKAGGFGADDILPAISKSLQRFRQ